MRRAGRPASLGSNEVDAYAAAISFSRQDEQQYAKLLSQNPRLAWSHISSTKRGQRSPQLTASSPQERNEKYTTHFHNLLSPSVSNTPVVFASHSNSNLIYNTGPITIQEYNIALNSCHNGKATGLDHIPTEVLRVAEVKQFVLQILNAALVQGATPKMMRTTALVPLWKRKGTIDEAGNFRGIALMSHLSKLYDKILLLRLRSCIDALLLPVQNGFHPRRGTVHHVLALRRLHDIASTFQDFPIHAIFVDFAKASDSVYFEATKSALRAWNVPPTLEKAIFSVIEEHEIHVRSDGIVGPHRRAVRAEPLLSSNGRETQARLCWSRHQGALFARHTSSVRRFARVLTPQQAESWRAKSRHPDLRFARSSLRHFRRLGRCSHRQEQMESANRSSNESSANADHATHSRVAEQECTGDGLADSVSVSVSVGSKREVLSSSQARQVFLLDACGRLAVARCVRRNASSAARRCTS